MKLTWFAVSHTNRLIKDFHDLFENKLFVLSCLLIYLCFEKTKSIKKSFILIKFMFHTQRISILFNMQNTMFKYFNNSW